MATKNIVPRATGEGKLGTSSKKWLEINTVTGSFELLKASGLQDESGNDLIVAGDNITVNKSASGQFEISGSAGGGGSSAADDITIGDAAVSIGTTSGDTTINSANGQTTTISGSNVVLDSENDISVNRNLYPENGSLSYQKFSLGSPIEDRQWKYLYLKSAIYFSGSTNGPAEMTLSHQEGEGLTIGMGVNATDNSEPYLNLSSAASQSLGPVFRISQNYTSPYLLAENSDIGTLDFFGKYGRDPENNKSTGSGTLAKVFAKRKDIKELSYTTDLVMSVASSGSLYDTLIISGSSFSQTASVDIPGHNATDAGLKLGGTLITATANELNLLDGSLDQTSPTSTIVDADRFIINDNGTMTHVSASVLKSYIGGGTTYASQAADFTAESGYHYGVDTSSGIITADLPSVTDSINGSIRFKIKAGTNALVLEGAGSETIDGFSSFIITDLSQSLSVMSDGVSNWEIF